jgi:rRNA pseudouridine-1189 N-methylase Emg1 (Nep1/Mra1 family)
LIFNNLNKKKNILNFYFLLQKINKYNFLNFSLFSSKLFKNKRIRIKNLKKRKKFYSKFLTKYINQKNKKILHLNKNLISFSKFKQKI